MFDILCGVCGGNLSVYDDRNMILKCEVCENEIDGELLKNFFDEKYKDKISSIEITNRYSAKISFK